MARKIIEADVCGNPLHWITDNNLELWAYWIYPKEDDAKKFVDLRITRAKWPCGHERFYFYDHHHVLWAEAQKGEYRK